MEKQKNKKKFSFFKRNKKNYSYAEAHNRAFWAFNKSSKIMIWASVFNVIGLMIGIIQQANTDFSSYYLFSEGSLLFNNVYRSGFQYSLCFSTNSFIFRLLEIPFFNVRDGNAMPVAFFSIIIPIAISFSGLMVYISITASQGKKWALYTQTIFYVFDTLMIVGCYLIGESIDILWIMVGLHVIILVFLGVSIYQYYHLFVIEKIYKGQNQQITISKNQGEKENGKDE